MEDMMLNGLRNKLCTLFYSLLTRIIRRQKGKIEMEQQILNALLVKRPELKMTAISFIQNTKCLLSLLITNWFLFAFLYIFLFVYIFLHLFRKTGFSYACFWLLKHSYMWDLNAELTVACLKTVTNCKN